MILQSLIDLKAQLNVIDDDADDDLLTGMIADALDHTRSAIGAETPVNYDDAPGGLRRAVLMLAAHFYENREAVLVGVSANELPLGFWELVAPHRKWVF